MFEETIVYLPPPPIPCPSITCLPILGTRVSNHPDTCILRPGKPQLLPLTRVPATAPSFLMTTWALLSRPPNTRAIAGGRLKPSLLLSILVTAEELSILVT